MKTAFEMALEAGFFPSNGDGQGVWLANDQELKAFAELVRADEREQCLHAAEVAAAHDLLEALKEIAADYADRFDLDDPSTNPGIKSTIKQARAAIAKATGEIECKS